jgi:serine/threonine-protein kinase
VKPGDTVTLSVAKAVEVPDLGDKTQDEATRQLHDLGFKVRVRPVDTANPAEDKVVLDQSPAAGEQRRRGSTVTIRVGHLTASATPTPTPSATPAPTATPSP